MTLPQRRPVVLCILDGVGVGRGDDTDAVHLARTPTLDRIAASTPTVLLAAHGTAVGLPTDEDMGNSEVGHNALGAGRVFAQGASLVNDALAPGPDGVGPAFRGNTWRWLTAGGTLHLIGLVSDGNVHSHVDHLHAVVEQAARDGVRRLRVHVLTDGRDVGPRTALTWVRPLETRLAGLSVEGRDYRVASGGGRMHITMDRYGADWDMVLRGWQAHVWGLGRRFPSASAAIEALYAEHPTVDDQWLPAFVCEDGPLVRDGDGVLLMNFRGDRALEVSQAFEGRPVPIALAHPATGQPPPLVRFAGIMQYDGDTALPARFLVEPPMIRGTLGEVLAAHRMTSFVVSETQKFGHVTYFFNGNRSGLLAPELERTHEVPSLDGPFDLVPAMKAVEVTDVACAAIESGRWDHVRLNLANGDMVGHTGNLAATVAALETVDACVARIEAAVLRAGGVLVLTADHGNADLMVELDPRTGAPKLVNGRRVARTAHSLNPVRCSFVNAPGVRLTRVERPGLANVAASLAVLLGVEPPADWLPSLVEPT